MLRNPSRKNSSFFIAVLLTCISSSIEVQAQSAEPKIEYKSLSSEQNAMAAAMEKVGVDNTVQFEFNVLTDTGESAGYYVGEGKGGVSAMANSLPPNWSMKAILPNEAVGVIEGFSGGDAWEYTAPDQSMGFWFPSGAHSDPLLADFAKTGSTKKIKSDTAIDKVVTAFYGKTDEATEKTREVIANLMVDEAKQIACRQKPRTIQFTATASLGASVTLIAGMEGAINYTGTWNTKDLCD